MAITDEAARNAERRLWLDGGPGYPALASRDALLTLPGLGVLTGSEATKGMEDIEGWKSVFVGDCKLRHCASTCSRDEASIMLIQHLQTVVN